MPTVIGNINVHLFMAESSTDQDAFTTIRIRRFDHERLMALRRMDESHWEVLRRLLDEYQLNR
tara:strand:- start:60 stop:248 length:189 start_codon:yes stop_codon:yes gene_type:complete